MTIEINGKEYHLPTSLSQITLGQKIAFEAEHGGILKEMAKQIMEMPKEDQELEGMLYQVQVACRSLSFFAGIPLEMVLLTNIDSVYAVYDACFKGLFEQQDQITLQNSYDWNGATWFMEDPNVTTKSTFAFNELIVSKQVVKAMSDMGKGEWDGMPYLAAVFLRKEGERFNEDLVDGEGARVKLMHTLPMDIALGVAFFLLVSMKRYILALPSSQTPRPRAASV